MLSRYTVQFTVSLQQNQQVHHQEDAVDPGQTGVGTLCPNVVQAVTILTLSELTFNWNTLPILFSSFHFQLFQFFSIRIRFLDRTLQGLAGKPYPPTLKITSIVSCTVNRITQYHLGIVYISSVVTFNLTL